MAEDARRRALEFLVASPGATDGMYAAAAAITQPGAHMMLVRLAESGLVRRVKVGRTVNSFITRRGRDFLVKSIPTTREQVDALLGVQPTLSRRQLAQRIGRSSTTVQYHVSRLRARNAK